MFFWKVKVYCEHCDQFHELKFRETAGMASVKVLPCPICQKPADVVESIGIPMICEYCGRYGVEIQQPVCTIYSFNGGKIPKKKCCDGWRERKDDQS